MLFGALLNLANSSFISSRVGKTCAILWHTIYTSSGHVNVVFYSIGGDITSYCTPYTSSGMSDHLNIIAPLLMMIIICSIKNYAMQPSFM